MYRRNTQNLEIRAILNSNFIPHWLLAQQIGVHEITISRWLKNPDLPEKKKQKIYDAIEALTGEKKGAGK